MDPVLQIDPERCVLVLGSQLAAGALALSEGVPAALSYAMVVEIGMQKMLELEGVSKVEDKARKQSLMLSAYELEPSFAASKVVDSLREHGVYQKWLDELFGSLLSLPIHRNQGGVVSTLNALQEKGALLVYTYYDTILDAALNTPPILLSDEAAVRGWATHRTSGLLHVHGAHSQPDSVKCDCVNYRQLVGEASGGQILREVCRNRCVVFLGFDSEFFDPFLFKFSRAFLSSSQTAPLLLSLAPKLPLLENFLTLRIPQLANLERIFISSSPVSRLGPTDSVENKISTTLLYSNKSSCKDAAERVKVTSGINVHQLTMRHEHLYHQLLLYLNRDGLKELWKILVAGAQDLVAGPVSPTGLHRGLLGIMLDRTVVWLNRAAALGRVTVSPLPSPMETLKGLQDATSHSSGHPRSGHTPSLTTNVSVISSMWTPIASPSVSKSSSTYTRSPTLPSPLISSTSRTSLGGMAIKSPQMGLANTLSPHHLQAHPQVRRVQSEKDHLTYQDRLAKQVQIQRRINGILHHTDSAPEMTGPSNLLPGYAAKPIPRAVVGSGKKGGSNQVYPFTRDGSQLEVKIECVDLAQNVPTSAHNAAAAATATQILATQNAAARNAAAQRDLSSLSAELKSPVPVLSPKGFAEERNKFISEAQNWSKQVDSELARKKWEEPGLLGVSGEGGREQLSLGLFTSRPMQQPSLSSKFSLEEQEKLLRQHFEFQQQQQLQLEVSRGTSSHLNPAAPSRSPHGSLSISTTHPGHTHSSNTPSKISPHQPSPSPSKSPLGLYQTSAAPSLFPFLNQAAANVPNPAANFLSSPSISQYQAALLSPLYQVAMQQLLSSQIQGTNPMLAPGPSILQSLVDKVPIFLPDGSITFIPTSSAGQGGALAETSGGHRGAEISTERGLARSPDVASSNHKRIRSPDVSDIWGSPPKRRRSSSLPDITQLPPQISPSLKEAIKEEDEVGTSRVIPMMSDESRHHRQLAPPTMIHIPQDMKLGDPMMGFPTPPQSSPLAGNFALSPIILSSGGFQPMTPVTPNQEPFGAEELRELVEAGGAQTPVPPSPEGSILPPFPAGRGPIQLWQFLLDLLLSPEKKHLIDWTGNGYEFRILQPEEIAKLWGARKNKPRMNYDKLSRGLRYYYSKGIMDKVQGKKLTFKYTCDVQSYVRSRQSPNSGTPRGGVVKYRNGSVSESLVPVASDGQGISMIPQQPDHVEEVGVVQDRSERSFSDLDLMAGFQSAVKASEGITGVVGVVSQGLANPLQGGTSLRLEGNQITSSATEVGICTEAI